ncbi:unnamed protein product [Peniophora sp. CBMAI 1063]|nr:unnamed protein product [Peniophora sp. CBMAI 1063]
MQSASQFELPITRLPWDLLKNTTYQHDAPEGYTPAFQMSPEPHDHRRNDYKDSDYCVTTLPQPYTYALERDGKAECMCTGWFKRMVLSTPGFPSPIAHPPKVMYEVRETDSGGRGVFATEDIKAGDLVLAERPLLIKNGWMSARHDEDMSDEAVQRATFVDLEKTLEMICMRMSPDILEIYESLPNVFKTDGSGPLTGIYRSNSRDLGIEDPEGERVPGGKKGIGRYVCIGALTSRFNHDCAPNAIFTFNIPSFSMEIHAVRPIAKGEEITLTYCHLMSTTAERRAKLKKICITCTCKACTDPVEADEERERVVKALLPKTSQGIAHAEAVLSAYEATGLQSQARYIELLQRVAQIQRKKGSKERADELDKLADRIILAQKGRSYKPEPAEPKPKPAKPNAPEPNVRWIPVGSEDDMMRLIMSEPDAEARGFLMGMFRQVMDKARERESR